MRTRNPLDRRPIRPHAAALLLASIVIGGEFAASPAPAQIPGGPIVDSLITVPATPPERVEIAMIFLAFDGSYRSKEIGRPRAAADSMARALLLVARGGADFDSLVKADSDQPRAKPLTLVNTGLKPATGERTRKMVEAAVGDMAFGMSPGETGLVVPNNTTCKYGYYVVRRRK